MADGRSRIILVSVAVAESLWLFALFSTLALVIDLDASPLPWVIVLATLAAAIVAGYLLAGSEGDPPTYAILQAGAGLIAIYLLMGAGSYVTVGGYDPLWLLHLLQGDFARAGAVSAVFGLIIALWLWRHGIKLATDKYPEDRLARIFKFGIVALAVATLVDQARDTGDIGASALFPPFFAATLVGLAVGRLPETAEGLSAGRWAKVIAVSVFGVMSTGLLLGLIGGLYGGGGVRLLYAGWEMLVNAFLWLLRWPVTWIVATVEWLLDLFGAEPRAAERAQEAQPSSREILGIDPDAAAQSGDTTVETIVNILKYPMIVIIIIIAFFILALAFRRMSKRDKQEDADERESIRGDAHAADDFAKMLGRLVPSWLRGRGRTAWRYPEGRGIAEVFRLYFDTLTLGIKWGMKFDPQMTPAERLPMLEAALPGAPVREVTERFNDACYGQLPSPLGRVTELSESLHETERRLKGR